MKTRAAIWRAAEILALLSALVGAAVLLASVAGAQTVSQKPDAQNTNEIPFTCTTTSQVALPANTKRRSILVQSPATNTGTIFYSFSGTATVGKTELYAGNVVSDDTWIGPVSCIVAAGTQTLKILETFR